MGKKVSTEATVKDIRRQTRRQHTAEEKIRIVLEGLRGERALPNSVAAKGIPRQILVALSDSFNPATWYLSSVN